MNFLDIAHDDHGLTPAHVALLQTSPKIAAFDEGSFVLVVLPLPDGVPSLPCALYGPSVGDDPVRDSDVMLEVRGDRDGPSRLIDLPHRPARNMVVCGMKGGVCFTAYGTGATEPSPMEVWDVERKYDAGRFGVSKEDVQRSREFWAAHALARWVGITHESDG